MSDTPEELTLIGYEKITDHGFALPCFGRSAGANTVYVARAMIPGDPLAPIAGFDVYEPNEMHSIPHGRELIRAWAGGPWVDVFLWNNELFSGTKPEIWKSLDSVRAAIAAVAPLTLLNLAEGVPEVASGAFARAAFNWFEQRQNTANAKAWLIGSYLRDLALRAIRRHLGDVANTGRVRQALLQVKLVPGEGCVVLRLPFLLTELMVSNSNQFSDLTKSAREFGIQINLPVRQPVASTATHWTKKITASDAQRKRAGHQRGSITLVRANYKIDAQTYFRRDFFGAADWIRETTRTGETRESAIIPFRVVFLDEDLGTLPITVSYAPNREAAQTNYTSLLHLGPLAARFAEKDLTDTWLRLDRQADGTYTLSIRETEPGGSGAGAWPK